MNASAIPKVFVTKENETNQKKLSKTNYKEKYVKYKKVQSLIILLVFRWAYSCGFTNSSNVEQKLLHEQNTAKKNSTIPKIFKIYYHIRLFL